MAVKNSVWKFRREEGSSTRFCVGQWGKKSKLLPDWSILCLWKHKCVSEVSRQGRLDWQENTGFWNGKEMSTFQVEKPFSRDSVASGVLCTQGPWDKQCAAHSFALWCSVLHGPISVSLLQANDVPAVRRLLFSWCTPSLLFKNAKSPRMRSVTIPLWTFVLSQVERAHYPIYSPIIRQQDPGFPHLLRAVQHFCSSVTRVSELLYRCICISLQWHFACLPGTALSYCMENKALL